MNHTQASGFLIKDPTAFTALTKIHKKPVVDCCFSPESDQILTASEDSYVVLWNLPPSDTELHDDTINDEHKLVCYRLSDHKTPVTSVAMHRRIFISASKDGQVKVWRLINDATSSSSATGQLFRQPSPEPSTYTCHQRVIESVCLSPDGRCFATGSADTIIKIWSTECRNKLLVSLPDGHNNWVKGVRWSKTNDSLLASCGHDGRVCIWDARTKVRQPPCVWMQSRKRVQYNCLDWHPVFEHHIATGATDSSCVIWDLRNKKQVQVYMEHNESVNSIAFNPGGSLLLSGSSDRTSRIFDVCEGRNMFTLISHRAPVTSVCFNASGDLFATGSDDRTVTVWRRNFDTVSIVLDEGDEDPAESFVDMSSEPGSSVPNGIRMHQQPSRSHQYQYHPEH